MEEMEIKVPKFEFFRKEDLKKCRCDEMEERSKKAEARIVELELEIKKRKSEYKVLEAKFKELEACQNKSAQVDLEGCRTRNDDVRELGNFVQDENKVGCRGGKEGDVVVDLTAEGDEENIADQLMVENHVLECEKRQAESEVVAWKEKYNKLELWVSEVVGNTTSGSGKQLLGDMVKGESRPDVKQLQINEKSVVGLGATSCNPDKGIDNFPASGTPYKDSPCSLNLLAGKKGVCSKLEGECHRKVRRYLTFDEERSPSKKIAPSTPAVCKPARSNVINIFDSDDESDTQGIPLSILNDQGNRKVCISTDHVLTGTSDGKEYEIFCQDYEDDVEDCKDNVPRVLTSKRKRAAKIVTSDTESDEDDNIPISKLKKKHILESIPGVDLLMISSPPKDGNVQCAVTHSRRRLMTLRQCEEKVKAEKSSSKKTSESKYGQGIPTTDDADDSKSEQVGLDSEDESFIDDRSDASDVSDADNVPSQLENESDGSVDFDEILSKLQRIKDRKFKWELEADMLSAFGKDLELCMRAVCALYRQQTSDEQVSKETKYENNRGFSKFDAFRGTKLAEFLTDGDPQGDLKKSKQQLEEHGSSYVELCRTLATRYSKQLFEIYKNKEDPLFLPC